MSSTELERIARARAARVWRERRAVELESAERFRRLAMDLAAHGASAGIVAMANEAARDEIRHAELCRGLISHFAESAAETPHAPPHRVAPANLPAQDALLYEIVAFSCVTETLSTALLGVLVDRARDSFAKQAMQSILRDEVKHSQLGWAFLAEQHTRGARDCISQHLPAMIAATLGANFWHAGALRNASDALLAGLGALEAPEQRRAVAEAFNAVIFPGLERFGIDTAHGKDWFESMEHANSRSSWFCDKRAI